MNELPKTYNAAEYEDDIYKAWESSGFFNPDTLSDIRSQRSGVFTIAIPPPNVTGQLHLGHAMMLAVEDLMIRYHRMKGDRTLWIPGLDHAPIATQNVVEKKIWKEEKKTRHDLGREEFLKRVDVFVAESKNIIRTQIKKMGASCDWSRERYTLDAGLSKAVQTMFIRMYEDGLIYRGDRIVNWCTRCASTLADDEVNYKEEKAKFYYLKYGPVTIGTARPETKFLDKIIIVHPEDKRYKKLHGKEFDVPWIEGTVRAKVIADEAVDSEIGTGAMTITPAHSFEDFELAQKYGFEIHHIIGKDGKMTEAAGDMAGMDVERCREKVVERLQEKGLVDRIDENYVHNLSVCYRCDTPIQPLVSKQWFVAVDAKPKKGGASLKQRAIEAVESGAITIIPDRFHKTYFQWMRNLHDWCISRQIWFGHRVPVWYRNAEVYVGSEAPQGNGWVEDPDTLDTWFSSGLWTFSTLGWPAYAKASAGKPKKTGDLATFHPTSVLETGYDILFFWVARMIMMTTYALDQVPFKNVYLHGLVRDKLGRKMSKSLGNGIDPLDVIAKYGADPVRLSFIIGSTPGNDVRLYDEKIAGFRNFVNKLWNIGRFVLAQQKDPSLRGSADEAETKQSHGDRHASLAMTLSDQWILSRLQKVIASVTDDLEHFRFSHAGETLRDFTWGDFADWYLEIKKVEGDPNNFLLSTFDFLLRLWHPFTPYVTEVLWGSMTSSKIPLYPPLEKGEVRGISGEGEGEVLANNLLMVAEWPKAEKKYRDEGAERDFQIIQDVVTIIRNVRATYRIPPTAKLTAQIITKEHGNVLTEYHRVVERLANLGSCRVVADAKRSDDAVTAHIGRLVIYVSLGGIVDVAKEQERIQKNIEKQMAYVSSLENKLANEAFTTHAPAEIIKAERAKWDSAREELERMRQLLV